MRKFDRRLKAWEINPFVRRRKRFIRLFTRWMTRTGHNEAAAALLAGIAESTLRKVLQTPTADYMVNPGETTMLRLMALAGIDNALRERRRPKKKRKPPEPIRKNRGYARRGRR